MTKAAESTILSPRVAVTAVFVSYGVSVGLWAGSVPAIARAVGIDDLELGEALTLYTLTIVAAMSGAGVAARFVSNRLGLLLAVPVMAAAGCVLQTSSSGPVFIGSLAVFGAGLGFTDVFMNAEAGAVEHALGRPVFATFHGAASLSAAAAAILGSLLVARLGPVAPIPFHLIAAGVAMAIVAMALQPHRLSGISASMSARIPRAPLVVLGLAAGLIIASETAGLLWSARLLDEAFPALIAIAGAGPAFYTLCNAVMRFNGDRLRGWLGDRRLILWSIALSVAGFLAVAFAQGFAARVAALAVAGLGTACIIPCMFAIAAGASTHGRAARLGLVSMVAGGPRIAAPWAFGLVSAGSSIAGAFGLCCLLLVGAAGLVIVYTRMQASPAPAPATERVREV